MPTAGDVDLGGEAYGKVVDLALAPGVTDVAVLLPHDVPTDEPPDICELRAGSYWVYVANEGAATIDLQLRASIDVDTSFACSQNTVVAIDENYWGVTLLYALGIVAVIALFGLFVWHCICSSAMPYHSDVEERKGHNNTMDELLCEEEERVQTVLALEKEGDDCLASDDATGAAEQYALAAVRTCPMPCSLGLASAGALSASRSVA